MQSDHELGRGEMAAGGIGSISITVRSLHTHGTLNSSLRGSDQIHKHLTLASGHVQLELALS